MGPTGLDLTAGSLPVALARQWASDPGMPTLFCANEHGDPGDPLRWITAGEIDERSREAAGKLARLGLGAQARVAWNAERSVASIVACLGVLRAGLVLVPVDSAYTEREMRHVITEVRPAAAISDDPRVARLLALESAEGDAPVAVLDTSIRDLETGEPATRDTASRNQQGDSIDACRSQDPALIGFTSGTTGAPKGAVLTHANLLANAESLRLAWGWTPDDRLVHALPLFHGHGLCAGLFGTLNAGASAVILGGFEPGAVLDAVGQFSGTLFFGVPTMYFRLAASGRASELSRLRLAVSGSAPLPAELHKELERASGARVLERYGMTETLLTVSNPLIGERRAGSIGFPLPGTEVTLDEPDKAQTAGRGGSEARPPAEEGAELLVRGPTVFAGYFGKPAQTADRFSDGWFRTGDLGVVERGYVRLLGRATEVVISGGHNVYPAEVEDVLLSHPDVAEVAVSGTPSDEWGEVVTAWVVPESGSLDVEALLAHAATGLAPYKRPRIVRTVDSLPRNSMGKVLRRSLS
jgi:malonyl-CoA/methylmalonyl-CoA synthetase